MTARKPLRTGLRVLEIVLFLGALVMINVSSASGLFKRFDLTESGLYELSLPSIDAVAALREPLTIRAFFTPNLPAPYNTVEQAVRDLLDEYAAHGGDLFNFQFVSMGAAEVGQEEAIANEELARQYLIYPIQIEQLDRDEVTLSTAYTGMALIHGDLIETIPSITDTSQLELTITEAITKLTERVSRLIALDEDIQVQLFFSSRLTALAPGVDQVPGEIEALVKELNASYFDRLRFEHIDATEDTVPLDEGRRLRLAPLQLQAPDGSAELAYAGLSVTSEGTTITMNLLQGSVMGYQLADMETIRRSLDDTLKNILGTQEEMGYLADFETPPYRGRANATTQTDMVEAELSNLFQLVSGEYTFRGLLLEDRFVPEGVRSMLVVGPQEQLNDWALFQIDQFLLRGGSLMLFLDSHNIWVSQGGGLGRRRRRLPSAARDRPGGDAGALRHPPGAVLRPGRAVVRAAPAVAARRLRGERDLLRAVVEGGPDRPRGAVPGRSGRAGDAQHVAAGVGGRRPAGRGLHGGAAHLADRLGDGRADRPDGRRAAR